jgi:hypothetical protein
VRLERERLAAETASAEASGTSSAVASDDDSVFGDKKRQKTKATSEPVPRVAGEPTEPTIIKDDKEDGKATLADLPDVSQLPDPGKAPEKK